jgi:hypothetical protein
VAAGSSATAASRPPAVGEAGEGRPPSRGLSNSGGDGWSSTAAAAQAAAAWSSRQLRRMLQRRASSRTGEGRQAWRLEGLAVRPLFLQR